ncbi:MAG TPA: alpha/beta fold hydrolase [Solirubrobacteraceae bacterium]|jgi:pimeloyl-ACP methyl ester carboxylesterase|nr:alpha/beta fold hydrolase [Solirubrobacteraceae bacterium]
MRGRASIAVALIILAALAGASSTAAALDFTPCPQEPALGCTTLTVPLDRTGHAPGTISLTLTRVRSSGASQSQSAVLALAGGPGQPALPLTLQLGKSIAPALKSRDLVVFDQRGTGRSQPLNCPVLDETQALESATASTIGQFVERCALQLGIARGSYTTQESVQDIEAVRAALGYEKLVLYGTSYGTKVALEYAESFPQHVESLVLDSVVSPDGPEPFAVASFQAISPMLAGLCSNHACARVTGDPLGELASLVARLRAGELQGAVYDGSGRRRFTGITETALLGILEAGDLNPALRALLPAAVHSALHHDPEPLLRLNLLSEGLIPNVPRPPRPPGQSEGVEANAIFLATSCEEKPLPWQREAPPAQRNTEALAALNAIPVASFSPFDAPTALENSLVPTCLDWPDASAPPPPMGTLPDVPTLILSGGQDLRTPTSTARRIAGLIPGSELVVSPYTGHSVLGADFSGCAAAAVSTFFGSSPAKPCAPNTDVFKPTPVSPTNLDYLRAAPRLGGRAGRTLTGVLDTIVDLDRQVVGASLQGEQELPSGASFGGLRGGYARLSPSSVRLVHYSFVPGLQLTGTLPIKHGRLQASTLRIGGPAAATGAVRLGGGKRVSGVLGGRRFNLDIARVNISRARGPGGESTSGEPSLGESALQIARFPLPELARLH